VVAGVFPDGVWLVELGALSDAERVPQAVATALGVREQPGEPLVQTLGEFLAGRRVLLVLDNCEHLVAACAALSGALLQRSPRLTILATSQEALRVPGEVTWPLAPLTVPPAGAAEVARLLACEAGRLFVERAQLSRPDFALTMANVEAVTQVCTRLDGVPLALELAAACLHVLTVPQLAARLDDRFRLLTAGNRLALPRQQTLRATLDWSYDLLTPPERALFARLAVFVGGWTLDAAEVVCGPELPDEGEVLPLLTQLVAKSLVKVEVGDAEARYTFLETIRAYAWGRLTASGEGAECRARHAYYYQQLAEAAEPQLTGPQQSEWLDRLEAEHDNLRAALGWSQATPDGGGVGLWLVGALSRVWVLRGYLAEGRDWGARVLLHPAARERTAARARALFGAGRLAHVQGDLAAARAPLEESAAIWRELGESRQLANAQTLLGLVLAGLGEAGAARAVLQESVGLLRQGGDPWGLARALFCLGEVTANEADYATATVLLDESLGLFRQVGDQAFIANTLMALGELAREQGDLDAAARLGAESLALYQAQGFTSGIAYTLTDLGDVAWAQGALATAREHYAESLRLCRDLADEEGIATGLRHLGQIAHAEGDLGQAAALLRESVLLKRRLGHKPGVAQALLSLGWVLLDAGAGADAAGCFAESVALAEELGSARGRADGLLGLAAGALAAGDAAEAARLLAEVAAVPGANAAGELPGQPGRYEAVAGALREV
jgi:non-specific serine/threonine protein kinase